MGGYAAGLPEDFPLMGTGLSVVSLLGSTSSPPIAESASVASVKLRNLTKVSSRRRICARAHKGWEVA